MKPSTLITTTLLPLALLPPTAATPLQDASIPQIDDANFIARIMDAHWYWRRIHCAQDLRWDPELAKQALESVNTCTKAPRHVRYFSSSPSFPDRKSVV